MDHLPIEVLHTICAHLAVEDVLIFRLLATLYAAVGAQYMLSTVSIAFLPESFARLKAISEHPVISQHVETLVYDLCRLPEITDFQDYKHKVHGPTNEDIHIPWPPPPESDIRALRAYNRGVKKFSALALSLRSQKLKQGWNKYLQLRNEVAGL
ncbi:hypothetical protein MMC17_004640 [Xylographa soralifera]|nr:hypothetical protein [Xylographa soralifera]